MFVVVPFTRLILLCYPSHLFKLQKPGLLSEIPLRDGVMMLYSTHINKGSGEKSHRCGGIAQPLSKMGNCCLFVFLTVMFASLHSVFDYFISEAATLSSVAFNSKLPPNQQRLNTSPILKYTVAVCCRPGAKACFPICLSVCSLIGVYVQEM